MTERKVGPPLIPAGHEPTTGHGSHQIEHPPIFQVLADAERKRNREWAERNPQHGKPQSPPPPNIFDHNVEHEKRRIAHWARLEQQGSTS